MQRPDSHLRSVPLNRPLTPRQKEALGFVVAFIKNRHFAPTIREVMVGMGLTSLATAAFHLDTLERKGYITRNYLTVRDKNGQEKTRCSPRSIVPTDKAHEAPPSGL